MPLPMDYEIVSLFMIHLAITGLSYSTINNELSALVTFAKLNRQAIDLRNDFGVNLTLKALHRILGDAVRKKDELFPNDLLSMKKSVDFGNFLQESVWLGVIFLYRLRKSHIFVGEFNHNLLRRSEVEFTSWGLIVHVTKSKTVQYRERRVDIPLSRDGGPLCVVTQLLGYFQKYPMGPDAPILSKIESGKQILVKYGPALELLKRWGKMNKIEKDLGMHSLRRGGATVMSLAGLPLEDIKSRGDWQSMSVLQYLTYPLQQKIAIEKKKVDYINQFC